MPRFWRQGPNSTAGACFDMFCSNRVGCCVFRFNLRGANGESPEHPTMLKTRPTMAGSCIQHFKANVDFLRRVATRVQSDGFFSYLFKTTYLNTNGSIAKTSPKRPPPSLPPNVYLFVGRACFVLPPGFVKSSSDTPILRITWVIVRGDPFAATTVLRVWKCFGIKNF